MQYPSGKFGLSRYISSAGSLGIFDIDGDFKIKFVVTGAAPSNTFEVRGRIQGEDTYSVVDTVVSNVTKTINVEEYDFLEIVCTTFDPVLTQVYISGSGFGGNYGLSSVSGPTSQITNVVDLYLTSSDNSVDISVSGETVNLRAVSATITPATNTEIGGIKLTGDLGGTANNPTVPGLAGKEPTLPTGTTSEYLRGDKTWHTLDKTIVGLGNIDNTSDANKPVSTAQAAADAAVEAYAIQRANHTGTQPATTITGLATVATSGAHSDLSGAGSNSHAQIDTALTRLANTSGTNTGDQDLSGYVVTSTTVNGHALSSNVTVTKSDVGLGNVANVDTTQAANITTDTTHRFVTDTQISTWTAGQTNIAGNSATTTALQTARNISGTPFDGTADITISHTGLSDIGSNTHVQIDTALSRLATTSGTNTGDQDLSGLVPKTTTVNGHALSGNVTVTKSDIGLSNVPNTDATVASNITTDSTHRFVTDTQISYWNAGGTGTDVTGTTTLTNNQSSAADVTGLIFSGSTYRSVSITYSISRATATNETACVGKLDMSYSNLAGAWIIENDASNSNAGITFDVSNAGQVTYTSTNISGTGYTGTIRWSAKTFGV